MVRKRFEIQLYGHGDLSKCLTKLKSVGTNISYLTVNEDVARFSTDQKGVKHVRRYRRRYGLKARITTSVKDPGLKMIFNAYRYVIAFIIPFAASFLLWTVNVESDIPEVAERIEEKLQAAAIVPLRPLALIPDEGEIRRNLMQDDPSLSWIRFRRVGTSLTIIPMLSPSSDSTSKEAGPPSDLIARTGGVITRYALTKGERIGHIHSTVKRGDVLATGILEQGDKRTVVGAEGAVFADYWLEYEFSMPQTITFKVQGEEKVEFIFNHPWKKQKDQALPFWRFVTTVRQVNEDDRQLELTEGMEQTVIIPLIKRKLLAEHGSEAIIKDDKILHVTFDNDKVKGTILFLVNDDIAIKRPIPQGD